MSEPTPVIAALSEFLDVAPDALVVVEKDGRVRLANEEALRLFGYAREALIGQPIETLLPERSRHVHAEHRSAYFDDPHRRPMGIGLTLYGRRSDGSEFPAEVSLAPIQAPGGTLVVAAVRDISERERAEEELRASEERYRTTLSNIPGAVYRTLPDWTAEFLGDLEGISGYTAEELEAREGAWRSVIHPDDRETVERDAAALLQRPTSIVQAYRIITKDSAVRWVEDRKTSVFSPEGRFEGIRGILTDITERKLLEDQLRQAQKMEAVGQLTGGLAHDLNNILTVVIGNAEVMADALPADAALQEDLTELLAAAKRGAMMISRLLQFSRRGMLAMRPVRPGAVVRDLGAMLRRLLPETVRLELADATGDSDMVLADKGAMEQMLMNLCTNARDAMPEGGTLRIECERTLLDEGYHATHPWVTPGAYVSVAVTDSGTGMDEETKRKLFEPFFTTKPASKGTGLGMAMVYGLMKQHKGMVHVYSEPGQGTTIKLYFPAAPEPALEAAAPRGVIDPKQVAGGTETILLAEDEPAIRRTTKRALEGKGYTVLMAEDGEEALELYGEHKDRIALLISDLVMPKLGGRQLVDALRQEGSRVPILFTSGYSPGSGYRNGEFPAGVEFLQKPWTLTDLLVRVRELLDG